MGDVEKRMSYWLAVPSMPEAPGAVQRNVTLVTVRPMTCRSVTVAGADTVPACWLDAWTAPQGAGAGLSNTATAEAEATNTLMRTIHATSARMVRVEVPVFPHTSPARTTFRYRSMALPTP